MGPPPFRFAPEFDPLTVPAFSLPFRVFATLLVWGGTAWAAQLWLSGALTPPGSDAVTAVGWPVAALALMLYTWWHLMTSRTTLSADALHQSWIWDKHMELRDLAYVKLIRVPGLDWLIAPRVYARTLLGKFAVFYASDPRMLKESIRLRDELKAFRSDL